MIGGFIESTGENLEFNVATASDVTIYFTGGTDGTKTSANDTAIEKYTDSHGAVKVFALRFDKNIQIVSINGNIMADPITCVVAPYIEKLDTPIITKMVIRTLADDTNVKIRVRGR